MNPNPNPNSNPNTSESLKPQDHGSHSADYAPYPKLDPIDLTAPPPQPLAAETWTSVPVESDHPKTSTTTTTVTPTTTTTESLPKQQQEHQETATSNTPRSTAAPEGPAAPISTNSATTMPAESNPYVSPGPAHGPGASVKSNCSPT